MERRLKNICLNDFYAWKVEVTWGNHVSDTPIGVLKHLTQREREPRTPMCQPMSRCSIWGLAMGVPPVIHFERWDLPLQKSYKSTIWIYLGGTFMYKNTHLLQDEDRICSPHFARLPRRGSKRATRVGWFERRPCKGNLLGILKESRSVQKSQLVGGLVAILGIFPYIGLLIIPNDELIFFRGVALAPPGFRMDTPYGF